MTLKTGLLTIADDHKFFLIDVEKIIQNKPYRKRPSDRVIVNQEVEKLLAADRIEVADPKFLSPVVLVTKADGSKRFCIDFRQLNDITAIQNYPIPHTQDLCNTLRHAKVFS